MQTKVKSTDQRLNKDDSMNRTKRVVSKLGIGLCSALLGCTTYGQPSVEVGVSVPLPAVVVVLPSVEIHVESDFYEPLTPFGEWVVIGDYGRCWRPARVEVGWRPYCNGNWERTDAGWYWVSDEPWAWATYHYGRWDFTEQYGWYWVPQTQWAPAWVSWHEGGGYIGWAPLQPSVRISASGYVGFNVALIPPRAFVFVEQRRFLDPIRPTMVVVNNTTIINKTTIISNTKMVNNTVINEGPATAAIEKASGRKVQAVQVQELRHTTEAAVVSRQRTPTATSEKKVQTPVRREAQPAEKKIAPAREPVQVEKPAAVPHEPAAPAPKNNAAPSETRKSAPAAAESKPAVKPEARPEGNQSPAIKEPTQPKADQHVVEKPARPAGKNVQPPAQGNPAASDNNGPNPADKDREKKIKE
jgi:hypothetical protein